MNRYNQPGQLNYRFWNDIREIVIKYYIIIVNRLNLFEVTMFKSLLLLIIFSVVFSKSNAQRSVISGYLLDSLTHFAIANGTVTNANDKKSVNTNEKGFFRLKVAPNDFIYATAKSYHYDTLVYSYLFTNTITIYLSPGGKHFAKRDGYNKIHEIPIGQYCKKRHI